MRCICSKGVSSAFAEDAWRHVHIGGTDANSSQNRDEEDSPAEIGATSSLTGGARFRNVKLCKRCTFTTIDPSTGARDRGGEPLKTLRGYRCTMDRVERRHFGIAPVLGVYLAVQKVGEIRVGDTVYMGSEE